MGALPLSQVLWLNPARAIRGMVGGSGHTRVRPVGAVGHIHPHGALCLLLGVPQGDERGDIGDTGADLRLRHTDAIQPCVSGTDTSLRTRRLIIGGDKGWKEKHKVHLQKYWPIFAIGSIFEVFGFFTFHPDLFTLVVCVKTCICLAFWLSRRADGTKVTLREAVGSDDRRASTASQGTGASRGGGPNINSNNNKPSTTNSNTRPITNTNTTSNANTVPRPYDPRFPNADRDLAKVGYPANVRDGMIYHLLGEKREKVAADNLKIWLTSRLNDPAKMAQRKEKYGKLADTRRAQKLAEMKGAGSKGGGGGGASSSSRASNTANSGRSGQVMRLTDQAMKQIIRALKGLKEGPDGPWDDEGRRKFFEKIVAIKDPQKLVDILTDLELYTQSGRRLNLAGKIDPGVVEQRRKRLINNMKMSETRADCMIEEMMDKPTVEEAEALNQEWKAVLALKGEERDRAISKYWNAYPDINEPNRMKHVERLDRTWD